MKPRGWIVLAAVGVLGVAAWLLWPAEPEPAPVDPEPGEDAAPERDWEDEAALFEDFVEEEAPASATPDKRSEGLTEGRWRGDPEARRERRERFRERMRNMTPEERRQYLGRRIEIVSLGATPPTLEAEDVMQAMGPVREKVRDCIRDNGGFREMMRAMRDANAADAGARRGLTVSFDVTPEGTLAESSLAIDPPPPEAFYGCFEQGFVSAQLPPPGEDGARVELNLGRGRGGSGGDGRDEARGGGRAEGRGRDPAPATVPSGPREGPPAPGSESEPGRGPRAPETGAEPSRR